MLDMQHGQLVAECENCDETLGTATESYTEAAAILRQEGWLIKKSGDDWQHLCPSCRRRGVKIG